MRIVSWNMARAFPPKGATVDPWEVLVSLSPDVALLQECRAPQSTGREDQLHHAATPRGWGTAVWSRFPLSEPDALPAAAGCRWEDYRAALQGYVASAVVHLPNGSKLSATSVHAYPAAVAVEALAAFDIESLRLPSANAVWPSDLVWWALRPVPSRSVLAIVGGDWNTARRFDEQYGPRGNQEWFERMAASNWEEVARRFYPAEVQTYFKLGKGPYQLDHLFASEPVMAVTTSLGVVSSDAVLGVSDHAALVMEVDMSGTQM